MSASAFAQLNTIDRKYVPIVQKTAVAPLNNLTISEWSAFRYDQQKDAWLPVPFQIDEIRDKGLLDHQPDDQTDFTDELAVMPTDLGDRALSSQWLNDQESRKHARIELQFVDPLAPEKSGWLYLYRHVAAKPTLEPFLHYTPGPAGVPAADTVRAEAFLLGHSANGWLDYLTLGRDRRNLIDRFKLRLAGSGGLAGTYEINEDLVKGRSDNEAVYFFPGPVRAFHVINSIFMLSKLKLMGLTDRGFRSDFQYFPHSFNIAAETDLNQTMLLLFGAKLLRQSLDFNENAVGMTVYSPFNRSGLTIDGAADTFTDAISGGIENNWVMAAGAQGAVILIFEISSVTNSKRLFYFHEDTSGGTTGDGTKDTGDGRSYGDMGIMLRAAGSGALKTDRLAVNYKGYFIDQPNLDAAFGEQIVAWDQNPLTMSVSEQLYVPSATKKRRLLPGDFKLLPAYPNPFSPREQKNIRFEFEASPGAYHLKLFNVLGQQVADFPALVSADGRGVVLWNGHDAGGEPLTSGVYLLHLQSGDKVQTQTLVIR